MISFEYVSFSNYYDDEKSADVSIVPSEISVKEENDIQPKEKSSYKNGGNKYE